MNSVNVGSNLQLLRAKKNVSQQEAADYLGITRQAYSFYENNKRQPDYETLLKLAEYFGICIGRLFDEPESIKNPLCLKGGENVMELKIMSETELLKRAKTSINNDIIEMCSSIAHRKDFNPVELDKLAELIKKHDELCFFIDESLKAKS